MAQQSITNPEKFLGNPVNVFRLVKLLSKTYSHLEENVRNDENAKSITTLKFDNRKTNFVHNFSHNFSFLFLGFLSYEKRNILPTKEDYSDTAFHVSRLHDIYNLNFNDTRLGLLSYKYPSEMMTGSVCLLFGFYHIEILHELENLYSENTCSHGVL